jgi:hypothetical protein
MKRLLVILTMLTLAVSLFAQEEGEAAPSQRAKEFDLEITGGVPVHWTGAEHTHGSYTLEDKTVTATSSLGLGLIFNGKSKKVGFAIDADFAFGQSLYGDPIQNSGFTGIAAANVLLGPVFYIYNGSFLRVPLAFGIHYYYYSNDVWVRDTLGGTPDEYWNLSDHQGGLGTYFGVQFHFNANLYIVARTNISVDFVRYHIEKESLGTATDAHTGFELALAWSVKPTIGLGIKF